MPERITLASIVVIRDGKRVRPELNKPFNYTKEEITSILEGHPAALRKPINESTKDDEKGPAAEGSKTPTAAEKRAAAAEAEKSGGAAPPAKDDDEL